MRPGNPGKIPESRSASLPADRIREERDKEFLAGACCSLGDVYRKQSMYERALPLYEKAIAYDQDRNSYLWTNKGIVLCRMDRREEAYQCFCRALSINPYDFSAIKNEIDILRSQGRTHELKKARVRLFSLYRQQPEAEELQSTSAMPVMR